MNKILLALLFFALFSCKAEVFTVEVIENSMQCFNQDERISIVASSQQLEALRFSASVRKDPSKRSKYDFEKRIYLYVGAGSKPSSGYRYESTGNEAYYESGKIVLPLKLARPKAGYAQLQVISSPCVLLSVDRSTVEKHLDRDIEFVLQGGVNSSF